MQIYHVDNATEQFNERIYKICRKVSSFSVCESGLIFSIMEIMDVVHSLYHMYNAMFSAVQNNL